MNKQNVFGIKADHRLISFGILFFRVTVASLILMHGAQKLFNFSMFVHGGFPDPLHVGSAISLGLVVFAEFFCAIALVVGFLTRLAVIPLIINMIVIVFVIHGNDPMMVKEGAVLYLITFITLLLTGPGMFSIDYLLFRNK